MKVKNLISKISKVCAGSVLIALALEVAQPAADLDLMFRAILEGGKYPFFRCVEFYSGAGDWNCKKRIAPEVG
jgi:hypothetical protein